VSFGTSIEELLTDYPHLTRQDVLAAVQLAAETGATDDPAPT
jgi:uncharacterized protein (DUF433 family)